MTDGLKYITREIDELKSRNNLSLLDIQCYIDRSLGIAKRELRCAKNNSLIPIISDSLIEMYKAASEAVVPEHKEMVLSSIEYWEKVSLSRKIK